MTALVKAARLLLTLLVGIAAGFLLLSAVYLLPVEPMAQNVLASVPALNGEWGTEDSYEQLVRGYVTTQLDNSTDAAMLLAAVHEDDASVFVQAAEGKRYGSEGNAYHTLLAFGRGEKLNSVSIARYWHGYLVLLKPLLLLCSYLDIRMLLVLVQGGMLAAVTAGLCKRGLGRFVPAFAVSLVCITPSITGFSLQFSTALCTCLAAMIALLYLPEAKVRHIGLSQIFLLSGMVTSYVDYLTYPLITLGMPLCLCLLLFPKENWQAEVRRFMMCCICWAVGYFGMWAGKWLIAGALSDEPWFWANLVEKIRQRSSGEAEAVTINYLDVIASQFKPFAKRAYLLAGAAALAGWLGLLLRRRKNPPVNARLDRVLLLAVTALMPFAWYFATKNHSYNHAFFTSRTLMVSVFALCCLLTLLVRPATKDEA